LARSEKWVDYSTRILIARRKLIEVGERYTQEGCLGIKRQSMNIAVCKSLAMSLSDILK